MTSNYVVKEYEKLFSDDTAYEVISDHLESMGNKRKIEVLRAELCERIVAELSEGLLFYPDMKCIRKDPLFKTFEKNISKLPETYCFFKMVYSLYLEDQESLVRYFDELIAPLRGSRIKLDEGFVVDNLMIPLKSATPGFWKHAQRKLGPICKNDGTHELCKLLDKYYSSDDYEQDVDSFKKFIKKYPDIVVAKECLADAYYNLDNHHKAIVEFEDLDEYMFYAKSMHQYYFAIAWSYGEIGNHVNEEENYRKALEIKADMEEANNNLGWSLYKQKKYIEAERIFKKCLDNGWDVRHAANNYVDTLIAEGKYRDAKAFIKKGDFKVTKRRIEKVKALPNRDVATPETVSRSTGSKAGRGKRSAGSREQFSSERALEDELTAQIESGSLLFGKKLEIYNRKGIYGRQYRIGAGRVDLLCEDTKGEIYVIELKKDSGYGDVYEQITSYIDWLEKSEQFAGKKIHGIICMNRPSSSIINKVRKDKRIKLYDYEISCTEIR